jgi:hypothetical protein
MRTFASALLALLATALPAELWACAVCFDTSDENRMAFLATTAILSLVPLGMVGGVGAWLHRRSRQLEEEEIAGAHEREADPLD